MVAISSLIWAVLLAAVLVFVVSSVVWMVLPHHKSDYKGLPDEQAVLDALGKVPPGAYDFPHMTSMDEMKTPEMKARFEAGPVGFFTVAPGAPNMGKNLGVWFVYCFVVSWITAYVATRTLPPGAEYLLVFQITCTVAWASYGLSAVSDSVWFSRPWSQTLKQLFDAFLYGLVTGGAFGWLWPG
jgi:hypothetical protein